MKRHVGSDILSQVHIIGHRRVQGRVASCSNAALRLLDGRMSENQLASVLTHDDQMSRGAGRVDVPDRLAISGDPERDD